MTKRMEGYRLEVVTFLCLSFQGVPRFSRFGSFPTTGPLAGRIPLRCPFSPIFFSQAIEILLFYLLLSHKSPFSGYGQFLAIATERRRDVNKAWFSTDFYTGFGDKCA